ncbi:hypothetical protein, partial [Lactobacillus crispatus]|uniref:hypothetical protein n=1 Tax=Lactobacillus crispatus TaxID=47770 RepID=UPI00197BA646
ATTASGIEPGLGRQPPLLVNWSFLINIWFIKTRNSKTNCHCTYSYEKHMQTTTLYLFVVIMA